METFAETIKNKRRAKGLSTRALERALAENQNLRLSRSFINYIENEKKKPTFEIAYALAQELGINTTKALKLAYRARADFDRNRERESLEKFLTERNLKGISINGIIK